MLTSRRGLRSGPAPAASFFFFFNDTATTEIYTLSLHDALPISRRSDGRPGLEAPAPLEPSVPRVRSEEHTSELQSQSNLVCRLLLEKKKKDTSSTPPASRHPVSTRLWNSTQLRSVHNDA